MMPCAKGDLTSAAVLAFLQSWNEFTTAQAFASAKRNLNYLRDLKIID